ncbi:hypothetical protein FDECE_17108 [Fusarium decemcellulare]|nr:hypothetical protein FDECE_17108 [Fusarium decemcellulare]
MNDTLCKTFVDDMAILGEKVMLRQTRQFNASTDMGNVSHVVPSFHGAFAIPTSKDVSAHNPKFAAAAGTHEAHEVAIKCAKGMAILAIRVLVDDAIAFNARSDFEREDEE